MGASSDVPHYVVQSPNLPKLTYRLRAVHSDNWPELALQEVANQVPPLCVCNPQATLSLVLLSHSLQPAPRATALLFGKRLQEDSDIPASQVEGVRVRQHLNPLRKELQVQLQVQDWSEKFADPERPLIVDVGCGPGRFLLALAQRFQNHNLLGLDIRERVSTC